MKRAALRLVLLLIGTAIALGALELGLRAYSALAFPKMMMLDDALGWKHATRRAKRYRDEFGAASVMAFNGQGLRGPERTASKPAGTYRILVLGDSFTEGTLISEDDLFTARLERSLPHTEVLNAAVGAYGTVQEYLYLRDEGMRFQPDLVMLVFYENDLLDNFMPYYPGFGPRPYATLDAGELAIVRELDPAKFLKYTLPLPLRLTLNRHSYLYYFANRNIYQKLRAAEMHQWERADAEVVDVDTQFRIFFALLAEMKGLLDARGTDFFLVLIPTVGEVAAGRSSTAEKILGTCREKGIRCLALIERLRHENSASEPLYYPREGHWTPRAHRIAAEAIGPELATVLAAPHGNARAR